MLVLSNIQTICFVKSIKSVHKGIAENHGNICILCLPIQLIDVYILFIFK